MTELSTASPGHVIPFNKPFIAGKELFYIAQAVTNGQIAADGVFTKRCSRFLEERFDIPKVLLTPSCTAALEMAAILCDLGPGDEVVMPSFTFVSTANAVTRLGATPVFVDIRPDTLNIDEKLIEGAVTERTRAILPVHYAGVGCEMTSILEIAQKYGLSVIEDAAQAVNASYKGKPLGSWGALGAFSFHETKNVICGEGGALCVNSPSHAKRAEILRDKGTNRQEFKLGLVDKYTWVDIGSSYVPSEVSSAFLWGQLEHIDGISQRRKALYDRYATGLAPLEKQGLLRLPRVPAECQSNFHMFYILLPAIQIRQHLIEALKQDSIFPVFHFVPLHSSPMGRKVARTYGSMEHTDTLSGRLLRLPLYYELTAADQSRVIERIAHHLGGQL